jgi:tetratricopeptide (TPR) repeat protein
VIREFAAQRLAGGPDREAIASRHARYVLRLAETAEPQLVRSETRRWQRQLRREQENVRSTLRWSLDHGEAEVGLRTSGALWRYWHYWAELREGRRWLEALLALPAAAQPGVARAKGLSGLAGVVYWQGEPGRAQALYDEALAIYRALGEERAIAETLEALSMVAVARNDLDAVVARKWEAREHYLSAGDDVNASFIDATMPVFAFFTGSGGSIEDAIAATREGIDISRRHGRAYDLGDWLGSLAQVYQMAGDYPRAIEAFRETARVWYELGHVGMLPWLKLLAALELAEGRAARAVRLAAIAAKAVENIGGELPDAFTGVMGDPLEDARPQLAPEEYERAVAEGRAMSFDEAAAYVLEDAADTTPDADAHRANDGGHHAVSEW